MEKVLVSGDSIIADGSPQSGPEDLASVTLQLVPCVDPGATLECAYAPKRCGLDSSHPVGVRLGNQWPLWPMSMSGTSVSKE
jgi:hypothetical protein